MFVVVVVVVVVVLARILLTRIHGAEFVTQQKILVLFKREIFDFKTIRKYIEASVSSIACDLKWRPE